MTVEERIPAALEGERVDRVVAMLTGLPRSQVAELVDAGAVRIRGRAVGARSTKVSTGDSVEIDVPGVAVPEPASLGEQAAVPVVAEDDAFLVVDKPADLVVHPGAGNLTGTMAQALVARYPELAEVGEEDRPGVVHRLDRGTSGLLVVARTPEAHCSLVAQLADRVVDRRYVALVLGVPEPPRGLVDAPVGRSRRDPTRMTVTTRGREARTGYERTATFSEPLSASLLECRLETGRTHQIRVHLAALGHPVAGDGRYGGDADALDLSRPFLHAASLAFDHPVTGERARFSAPLPPDLVAVLGALRT